MNVNELIEYIVVRFSHDRAELASDMAPQKLPPGHARVYVMDLEYDIHAVESVEIDNDGDLILCI